MDEVPTRPTMSPDLRPESPPTAVAAGLLMKYFKDAVWWPVSNWPDAVTWRTESATGQVVYVKLASMTRYPRLLDEGARTRWARPFLPVADVLECGSQEGTDWLATRALPGVDATDEALMAQPEKLVDLLAGGLRRFHQAPVAECPFPFTLEVALEHVRWRAAAGHIDPARDFHPEHRHLSLEAALGELERLRPADEDLVVCHGDYCLPNIVITDGQVTGFVDLGELGVADRWWDLAVATWSLTWNLGEGFEDEFLRTYGIGRDEERIRFYRLLYDLVS